MSAIAIAGIAFASIVAVTLLGMLLRSLVPDRYLSAESKEVVGLATALIATISAVLLGLLISSPRRGSALGLYPPIRFRRFRTDSAHPE